MAFRLLGLLILMPGASPGVWPSDHWCGLTRLWQGRRQRRIASPFFRPCTAFSRCCACGGCSSIWTQLASCSPVRQIRTRGRSRQEQCRPVPARLEKCCNCHKSAGNAHKGRVQRQSNDSPCPEAMGSGIASATVKISHNVLLLPDSCHTLKKGPSKVEYGIPRLQLRDARGQSGS